MKRLFMVLAFMLLMVMNAFGCDCHDEDTKKSPMLGWYGDTVTYSGVTNSWVSWKDKSCYTFKNRIHSMSGNGTTNIETTVFYNGLPVTEKNKRDVLLDDVGKITAQYCKWAEEAIETLAKVFPCKKDKE